MHAAVVHPLDQALGSAVVASARILRPLEAVVAIAFALGAIGMGRFWLRLLTRPEGKTVLESATPFRRRPLEDYHVRMAARTAKWLVVAGVIGVVASLVQLVLYLFGVR